MIRVDVVPAEPADVEHVAAHMRADDRYEAEAATALDPGRALWLSATMSDEVWAGRVDGVAACLFGVGRQDPFTNTWRPWLIGTDAIDRAPLAFLRRNRAIVHGWGERFPLLENWVSARNRVSAAWLAWLGFVLDAPAPFGPYGVSFRRFEMRSPCARC
jgi:hypothetical protein